MQGDFEPKRGQNSVRNGFSKNDSKSFGMLRSLIFSRFPPCWAHFARVPHVPSPPARSQYSVLMRDILGAFLGHIMELGGPRGLFDTGKSSCMWSVATISLHLAILNSF